MPGLDAPDWAAGEKAPQTEVRREAGGDCSRKLASSTAFSVGTRAQALRLRAALGAFARTRGCGRAGASRASFRWVAAPAFRRRPGSIPGQADLQRNATRARTCSGARCARLRWEWGQPRAAPARSALRRPHLRLPRRLPSAPWYQLPAAVWPEFSRNEPARADVSAGGWPSGHVPASSPSADAWRARSAPCSLEAGRTTYSAV